MKILVVIPSFNSASTLQPLVSQILLYGQQILVIDDGSSDGTSGLVFSDEVTILRHETNRGLSQTMSTAFSYAAAKGFTHILAVDSDYQHDPSAFPGFLSLSGEVDLAVGTRFPSVSPVPSCKISSNLLASLMVEEVTKRFYADVTCGYRLYKLAAFAELFFGDSFEFVFSSLFQAIKQNYRIAQVRVPVVYLHKNLLSTRATELISFFNQLSSVFDSAKAKCLLDSVTSRQDFSIDLSGLDFCGFYLSRDDSYIVQCDLARAAEVLSSRDSIVW